MLKQQRSLKFAFVTWIAVAFLICFALPISVRITSCDLSRYQHGAKDGNISTNQGDEATGDGDDPLIPQQENTKQQQKAPDAGYHEYLSWSGFCEETKPTDFALVFFTACLVVVGWFTIVSGERNAKDLERAYIFGTPQIDTKQTIGGSIFVEIIMQNYGRTVGTVKIIYGEVSPTVEPFGRPIYKNGSARTANGALGPTLGIPVRAPVTFECPVTDDFYFFGYIEYDDLFRRPHTSRFCAKIFLDNREIEAAGPEAFHDWN